MRLDAEVQQRLHILGVNPADLHPFLFSPEAESGNEWRLGLHKGRLSCTNKRSGQTLLVDFLTRQWRHRASGHLRGELVVKAVFGRMKSSSRPLDVLDATAGLGRDSLLLALAGAHVTACERHPVVHALLADGLWRAADDPVLGPAARRITLHQEDFRHRQAGSADVIYLDPMFPPRQKSAQVKKAMQALHQLVGIGQTDADDLLEAARQQATGKVVVKRPRHAPFLHNRAPSSQVTGKTSRFDVYVSPC